MDNRSLNEKVKDDRDRVGRGRVGRGNSIYDNASGGEIWVINDEDPDKINQGFETCAVLRKSSKCGWSVIAVDEGFKLTKNCKR